MFVLFSFSDGFHFLIKMVHFLLMSTLKIYVDLVMQVHVFSLYGYKPYAPYHSKTHSIFYPRILMK